MPDEVVTPDERREILLGAVDVLEKYGWTKKQYGNEIDGFCLIGAIGVTIFGFAGQQAEVDSHQGHLYARVVTDLGRQVQSYNLTAYNDKPETTKEDVVKALREAVANVV